jgi:hypothetical protein
MESKLKKYWELSVYSEAISKIDINSIQNKGYIDFDNIYYMAPNNNQLLLAPLIAIKNSNIFCPFWLQVTVIDNQIIPNTNQLLPIFPQAALDPFCTGYAISFLRDLEQTVILNPPEWQHDTAVSLDAQIAYSKNILYKLTYGKWQVELEKQGYIILASKMLIIEQSSVLSNLDKLKLNNINNYKFNLDSSQEIEKSADNCTIKFINLFNMPQSQDYMLSLKHALNLSKKDFITIEVANNCGKEAWIANYVANIWLAAAVHNTDMPFITIVNNLEKHISPTIFSIYNINPDSIDITGLDIDSLRHNLIDLYHSEDNSFIKDKLELNSKQKERFENLLVLWDKQVEMTPLAYKLFGFIPLINQTKLKKMRRFFAKHLKEYDVSCFSEKDMRGLLIDLIKNCSKKEDELTHKYKQYQPQPQEISKILLQYWRCYAATYDVVQSNNLYEHLIFTDANLLDSCSGILLAAKASGSCILFGNREIKYHSPVISQIEESNLLAAEIIQDAELYDELEYNCLLSTDNYFAHACSLAEDYAPMYQLNKVSTVAEGLVLARNSLAHYIKLDFAVQPITSNKNANSIIITNIASNHRPYCGSRINDREIEHIITWIKESQELLEQKYSKNINQILVIFTCFAAQKLLLMNKLNSYGLLNIQVKTVAEYVVNSYPLVLFSPVYTAEDTGPFMFDEGNEVFYKMLNCCEDQLLIFGDKRLFNLHRHSASGIIAGYLKETADFQTQPMILA